MQSVPFTTEVVSPDTTQYEVYSTTLCYKVCQ